MLSRDELERLGYRFIPKFIVIHDYDQEWSVEFTPKILLDIQGDARLEGSEEMLVIDRQKVAYKVTLQEAIEAAHVHYVKRRVQC